MADSPHRQRNFSFPPRHQTDDCAHLADCEKTRETIRTGSEYLSAPFATQFRHAFTGEWRRLAHHSRDARPCRYFDDTGLHACRSAAIESGAPEISSAGVAEF